MEDYVTFTNLIGVRDANLSPYRDARVLRYKSVQKMMDLIYIAKNTSPKLPIEIFQLDQYDRKLLFILSWMGWFDAFPRRRPQEILQTCFQHRSPARNNHFT